MASLWLRLYTETLNDPKVQKLPSELFKAWINILCVAKEYDHAGDLPPINDLAFALRITRDVTLHVTRDLFEADLLIETGEPEVYYVHGWEKRQFISDTDPTALERKRRQRNKLKSVTEMSRVTSRTSHSPCHGYVTRTEQRREETEKSKAERESPTPFSENPEPEINFQPDFFFHPCKHSELWNSLGLPKFTRTRLNISSTDLETCRLGTEGRTFDEIQEAMKNYATVQHDQENYKAPFPYTNLINFLAKGVENYSSLEPFKIRKNGTKQLTEEEAMAIVRSLK